MPKYTILIIEDEKEIAENIAVRLEVEHYGVLQAHDGKMGVDTARKEKPD